MKTVNRFLFHDAVCGRSLCRHTRHSQINGRTTRPLWFHAVGRHGLAPGTQLAQEGFIVSPRLADAIGGSTERLSRYPERKAYFFNLDGTPLEAGSRLQNTQYYETLRFLATYGADEFYTGQIAKKIVSQVRGAIDNPGVLSEQDFLSYRVKERPPVCLPYKEYDICGMGPPSSGALTVGQILGITEQFDLAALGPNSPEAWQIIGDASRLAFADRGRYIADTDFVPMPQGLLDKPYLAERAKLITKGKALESVGAGEPEWRHPIKQANDIAIELPSTSHISIVDKRRQCCGQLPPQSKMVLARI